MRSEQEGPHGKSWQFVMRPLPFRVLPGVGGDSIVRTRVTQPTRLTPIWEHHREPDPHL